MAQEAAKVARACTDASETNILNLSNCSLKQIPMAVYLMTKSSAETITKVDLSNNELKTIPDKIFSHFHAASEIDLSGNGQISEASKEKILNCFGTERTEIKF